MYTTSPNLCVLQIQSKFVHKIKVLSMQTLFVKNPIQLELKLIIKHTHLFYPLNLMLK